MRELGGVAPIELLYDTSATERLLEARCRAALGLGCVTMPTVKFRV